MPIVGVRASTWMPWSVPTHPTIRIEVLPGHPIASAWPLAFRASITRRWSFIQARRGGISFPARRFRVNLSTRHGRPMALIWRRAIIWWAVVNWCREIMAIVRSYSSGTRTMGKRYSRTRPQRIQPSCPGRPIANISPRLPPGPMAFYLIRPVSLCAAMGIMTMRYRSFTSVIHPQALQAQRDKDQVYMARGGTVTGMNMYTNLSVQICITSIA